MIPVQFICEGCADPGRGLYLVDCRGCKLRDLALGPLFFESMRAGKLSQRYREALRALGEEGVVHAEVRGMAKTLHVGGAL